MTTLPTITDLQLTILLLLYKFRFLNTHQIQKLLNYNYPQTVQLLLKDLREKRYVQYRDFDRKKFGDNTKPAIYHLTKLARRRLKTHKKCEITVLNRVYQEGEILIPFINRYIFLADLYLNLRSQEGNENLKYFTQDELRNYDYFPKPLPDGYIAIKGKKKTKRYFLFLLDERAPWYALEYKIKRYLDYVDDNSWAEHTDDPLPSFLLIVPHERFKKKIFNLISESMVTNGSFYLTTKKNIQHNGFKGDVWEKVE